MEKINTFRGKSGSAAMAGDAFAASTHTSNTNTFSHSTGPALTHSSSATGAPPGGGGGGGGGGEAAAEGSVLSPRGKNLKRNKTIRKLASMLKYGQFQY